MSFFATPTINDYKENVFKLTNSGLITVILLIVALVVIAIILRPKTANNVKAMATTQLVFSSAAMALAIVTAEIKFTRLPMGYNLVQYAFHSPHRILVRT